MNDLDECQTAHQLRLYLWRLVALLAKACRLGTQPSICTEGPEFYGDRKDPSSGAQGDCVTDAIYLSPTIFQRGSSDYSSVGWLRFRGDGGIPLSLVQCERQISMPAIYGKGICGFRSYEQAIYHPWTAGIVVANKSLKSIYKPSELANIPSVPCLPSFSHVRDVTHPLKTKSVNKPCTGTKVNETGYVCTNRIRRCLLRSMISGRWRYAK